MYNYREFEEYQQKFQRLVGKRDLLQSQLHSAEANKIRLDQRYEDALFLRALVQEVAQQTMNNLSFHISSIVTAALKAIPFPDCPTFEAEFVKGRHQVECYLWFVNDGIKSKPIESSGGGTCDVASFALRLTYWSLKKNRPSFILDEPFKYVSADLQPHCAEMINMLSEKMGVQIIMISHLPEIDLVAEKEYDVSKKGGKSIVKEVK
jgi:DNA repair ATPase RecN